jgi:hypothetical protein
MVRRLLTVAAAFFFAGLNLAWAQTPRVKDLEPTRKFKTERPLTDDDGEIAADLSGIACVPPVGSKRICLVIDDQGRFAQFTTIEGNRLNGGAKLPLIGKGPSGSTLGSEPKESDCSDGKAKFKDLDGEGVAFAFPYFYVAGSHGCSGKGNKFRSWSFIPARVRVDRQGRVVDHEDKPLEDARPSLENVETTYRLAEALKAAPKLGRFFGEDLNGAD